MKRLAAVAAIILVIGLVVYEPAPQPADAAWETSAGLSLTCPSGKDVHLYGWVRWNGDTSGATFPVLTRSFSWQSGVSTYGSTTWTNDNISKRGFWDYTWHKDTNKQSVTSAKFSGEFYWWDAAADRISVRVTAGCGA